VLAKAADEKSKGTAIFNETSSKTEDHFKRAREMYIQSSSTLIVRSEDFVKHESVKGKYLEGAKSALMNAAMMSIKLKDFVLALDQLKYSKQFFKPEDDTSKVHYRMGAR
jgi:hypothetical protein